MVALWKLVICQEKEKNKESNRRHKMLINKEREGFVRKQRMVIIINCLR